VLAAVVAVVWAQVALGVWPASAPAQQVPPAPPTTAASPAVVTRPASATDPATIADDRVAPEILGVAIEGADYQAAMGTYRTIAAQLDQAVATLENAGVALVELDAQEIALRRQLRTARERREVAEAWIDELQATIDDLLVTSYINGDSSGGMTDELELTDATSQGTRRALTDSVLDLHRADLRQAMDERDRSTRDADRAGTLLESVIARRDETRFVRDSSQVAAFVLTSELSEQAIEVADARLTSQVQRTDFSFVALDAYWKAAATLNTEVPTCRIRWQVLAGISRTEGRHGTYGGSSPNWEGDVDPPIIGIPLNGGNNTAVVTDSDGGQWDGDVAHDRAVGPMQFIPSSWRFYGADGDGDGEADPQNLYDATLAAGRLLCRQGTAYDTDAGLGAGLFTYNRSRHYVDVVSGYVRAYDELELL
jgi:membrane-bound lytic murein transglycosylase B